MAQAERGGAPAHPAHLQPGRVRLTAARSARASPGQLGTVHRLGEQLLSGIHAHAQVHRLGRAQPPQNPRAIPRLRAIAPNQLWSWDITYLPTTVRGIWLYLYLVIVVWTRKVVACDVAEREDRGIAADLVSRDCLRERISKGRKQPLTSMPTMATPCVRPRWNAAWKYWASSGRSPGHGSPTTTPTRNRCSGR